MSGFLFFTSCDKAENATTPLQQIDKITITDQKGNVINEYQYDLVKEEFIGNAPVDKATTIRGTRVSVEPNNSGGHNYRCSASQDICYDK